jgi:hypothetical protein
LQRLPACPELACPELVEWVVGLLASSCIGVLEFMKSQTPSTKLQTNLKFQYQMTKTGFEF